MKKRGRLLRWREPERGYSKFCVKIPFRSPADVLIIAKAEKRRLNSSDRTEIELLIKREFVHWVQPS